MTHYGIRRTRKQDETQLLEAHNIRLNFCELMTGVILMILCRMLILMVNLKSALT